MIYAAKTCFSLIRSNPERMHVDTWETHLDTWKARRLVLQALPRCCSQGRKRRCSCLQGWRSMGTINTTRTTSQRWCCWRCRCCCWCWRSSFWKLKQIQCSLFLFFFYYYIDLLFFFLSKYLQSKYIQQTKKISIRFFFISFFSVHTKTKVENSFR